MITAMEHEELTLEEAAEFLEVQPGTILRLCTNGQIRFRIQLGRRLANNKRENWYWIELSSLVEYQDRKELAAQGHAGRRGLVSDGHSSQFPELFRYVQIQASLWTEAEAARPTDAHPGTLQKEIILNARNQHRLPLWVEGDQLDTTPAASVVEKSLFEAELAGGGADGQA